MAKLRYEKTRIFTHGTLLRPPMVESDIPDTETTPAMSFTDPYIVSYVKSGIWEKEDGQCEIFVINISKTVANAKVSFEKSKYDIDFSKLKLQSGNGSFTISQTQNEFVIEAVIEPNSYLNIT